MSKEIEVKVYNIDNDNIRQKLLSMGATHSAGYQFRFTYKLPELLPGETGYVRVRKELDDKITMTTKRRKKKENFFDEIEIIAKSSFLDCKQFLESIGLTLILYAEQYREKFNLPMVKEINLDTVPGVPTYLEIEAENFTQIQEMARSLDIHESQFHYGTFTDTYHETYGIPRSVIDEPSKHITKGNISLTFANIYEEIGAFVTKNNQQFAQIARKHAEKFVHK